MIHTIIITGMIQETFRGGAPSIEEGEGLPAVSALIVRCMYIYSRQSDSCSIYQQHGGTVTPN